MSQLSRPYQVALAAILVLALGWFVLLHSHHSENEAPTTAANTPAPTTTTPAAPAATSAPSHTPTAPAGGTKAPTRPVAVNTSPAIPGPQLVHRLSSAPKGSGAAIGSAKSALTGVQREVARELAQGKFVVILFWNPGSFLDRDVRKQVRAAAQPFGSHVVVHDALASQVGSFGSITSTVTVTQTPTLLIVNPRGQVSTIAGYADAYGIAQRLGESLGADLAS